MMIHRLSILLCLSWWVTSSSATLRGLVSDEIAQEYEQLTTRSFGSMQVVVNAAQFEYSDFVTLDLRGNNLAYLRPGEILGIPVTIPATGLYRVDARICNPEDKGDFWVYDVDSAKVLIQSGTLPVSKHWNDWKTVRLGMIELEQGKPSLHMLIRKGSFNLRSLRFTKISNMMANFLSPNDDTETYVVPAGALTAGDATPVTKLSGIPYVGKLLDGEALEYEFPAIPRGMYQLELGLSAPMQAGNIVVRNAETGAVWAQAKPLPATGGWYSWDGIVFDKQINLKKDADPALAMELVIIEGGFNLRYLSLARKGNADLEAPDDEVIVVEPPTPPEAFLFYATEASDFDGVTPGGTGLGFMGGLDDDDWLEFVVDVPVEAEYNVSFRYATVWAGAGVEFQLDGTAVTATKDMAESPGWEDFVVAYAPETILMSEGEHTLRLRVLVGGWNIESISLDPIVDEDAPPPLADDFLTDDEEEEEDEEEDTDSGASGSNGDPLCQPLIPGIPRRDC